MPSPVSSFPSQSGQGQTAKVKILTQPLVTLVSSDVVCEPPSVSISSSIKWGHDSTSLTGCHSGPCSVKPEWPFNMPPNVASKPQAMARPEQAISSFILDIRPLLIQPHGHITPLAHTNLIVPSASQIFFNVNITI